MITLEELQNGYGIVSITKAELDNKEGLSWWEKEKVTGLKIALKVFREYAKINKVTLLEPKDTL